MNFNKVQFERSFGTSSQLPPCLLYTSDAADDPPIV